MQKRKSLSQQAVNKVIGRNVRKIRERSGANVLAVAECLGVTRQAVSLFEKGKLTISVENLNKLAKYFEISVTDFYEGLYIPKKK